MIVTIADVLAGIKRFWDADPDLRRLVPGGLWFERPTESAATPYAVGKVVEADPARNSSSNYVQAFNFDLRVWSEAGPTDSGTIQRLVDLVFHQDRFDQLRIDRAIKVLDLRLLPGALEADTARKESRDVMLLSRRWEILIQGSR